MNIRYPGSFFKLLAVGFVLGVLPLAAALVANTLALKQLARQSQRAVYDAARIAHDTRMLTEILPSLERSAQQSLILGDRELRERYAKFHKDFQEAAAGLTAMPLEQTYRALLAAMVDEEAAVFAIQKTRKAQPRILRRHFDTLAQQSQSLLARANAMIDQEAMALRARAQEAETNAQIQFVIILPLVLLIVAGFAYLLARPIAQLESGIRKLGEQKLAERIRVDGPADLVQLGERLDWLRLRLQELEEQKSQFLRHVSHALKTPLTAIREGSELLTEGAAGELHARQLEIATIVRENGVQLQQLIEDLLRHGEAEFRATHVAQESIDVVELIEQIADKQKMAMAAKRLSLGTELETKNIVADRERLRVIVDNLLSNAIKHAPEMSKILLHASTEADGFCLRVLDEGPGVAPTERERIFEPFYCGALPGSSKVNSTGLGLAICLDHAKAMGGSIKVGTGRGDFQLILPSPLTGARAA